MPITLDEQPSLRYAQVMEEPQAQAYSFTSEQGVSNTSGPKSGEPLPADRILRRDLPGQSADRKGNMGYKGQRAVPERPEVDPESSFVSPDLPATQATPLEGGREQKMVARVDEEV